MRAYLINTAGRTIAEVIYNGHSTDICDLSWSDVLPREKDQVQCPWSARAGLSARSCCRRP
jgi:hypothetical protein